MTTIDARPAACDIELTRANDFAVRLRFKDLAGNPLTTWAGYTLAATLALYPDDPGAIDFDVDDSDAADAEWVLSLPADVAESLGGTSGRSVYKWDLLRVDDAEKLKTLFGGDCTVTLNITVAP